MSSKTSQKARPREVGRQPHKKARKRSIIAFEMVRLDRGSLEPLHQQLYRQIRLALDTGSFSNGSLRLPSSRSLATDLGITRFTVKLPFSKLHAEGYPFRGWLRNIAPIRYPKRLTGRQAKPV